jgi:hypothetical protein
LEAQTTKGLGGKEPNVLIIGCDYHPGFQQIAFVDTETGACGERRLAHREQAEQSYREFKERNLGVRVGMEASGHPVTPPGFFAFRRCFTLLSPLLICFVMSALRQKHALQSLDIEIRVTV